MTPPPLRTQRGIRGYLRIGCIGAVIVFGILAIVSTLLGGEDPTPTEKAEKRKGVEQAEKQQDKQPKQEIEKAEPDAGAAPPSPADGSGPTVKLTRVVDGDTIEIVPAVDGKDTVRLIGIDAPEDKKPGCRGQPLAQEAEDHLANWEGSEVRLEFDEERTDRYGRLLAYVHDPPPFEVMLNKDLILGGYAQVYIVPPNTKYEDRLREAQQQAKDDSGFDKSIWALSSAKQNQLADHGNGIGKGDGACPPERQQNTATATATGSPSSNPSPNRNYNVPNPNARGTAPSTASPGAGGGDIDCDQVDGPIPVPPGDPNNLDGDGDGLACE